MVSALHFPSCKYKAGDCLLSSSVSLKFSLATPLPPLREGWGSEGGGLPSTDSWAVHALLWLLVGIFLRFAVGFSLGPVALAWRASLLGHFGNYLPCTALGPTSHTMPHYQALVRAQGAEYEGSVCGAPLSVLETSLSASVHYFSGSNFPELLKCLSRFLILEKDWNIHAFSPMV